ncbi:MAG: cupin domain-containing protein [Bacteroidota bacterium]|nr:cupin domain-containing protein [Bacteroidota bacterium]MDP4212372.1 cupin domain-containing protein [Bacteroidota bacterium]
MEEKFNEATRQRPEGDRVMDATMATIGLPSFIKQIKQETAWKERDRNAITLYKTNGMSIVLVALHAGAEMKTHTADGIISLQIIEGRMKFNAGDRFVELDKGEMLTLHKGIPHNVAAIEETVFLLTLVPQ